MTKLNQTVFKLEVPDKAFGDFGWSDLREFMDKLSTALQAMPDWPKGQQLLPLTIHEGSLAVKARTPDQASTAINTFCEGPTPTWTANMRKKTQPFYNFVKANKAQVEVVQPGGAPPKVVVPPKTATKLQPKPVITEYTALTGVVVGLYGQKKTTVEVKFSQDGTYKCTVNDLHLARRIGQHYLQEVVLEGLARRNPDTGSLIGFQVQAVRTVQVDTSTHDSYMTALHRLVGNDLEDLSLKELLRDRSDA
jgi:hypothetical protein